MLEDRSLRAKLLAVLLGGAVATLAVCGNGYRTTHDVISRFDHIVKVNFENTISLTSMRGAAREVRSSLYRLGIQASATEDTKSVRASISTALNKYEELDEKYRANIHDAEERELYASQSDKWKSAMEKVDRLIDLSQGTPSERARFHDVYSKDYKSPAEEHLKRLQALVDFQINATDKWVRQARQGAADGNLASVAVAILAIALALAFGMIVSYRLTKRLDSLSARMAQGAAAVTATSKQLGTSGTGLSSSTTEQAAALQETMASIDQVNAMVNKNADNANRSCEVSAASQEAVHRGKRVVDAMIQSIESISLSNNDIMKQIEASNQQISDIVKVISEIGSKTKVINDIVFQTKLLSFNASVEAARAGEHGKGFAVVAEEVGNLAQMSGNAAKEISQMLDGSVQKVDGIVNETKSKVEKLMVLAKERIQAGTSTAKQCVAVLDEIVSNVTEVNQMVSEISTASREQAQGVEEITKAMGQIDQVTQQNSTSARDVASAADQLTSHVESFRTLIHELKHVVDGDSSSNPGAGAPPAASNRSNVIAMDRAKKRPREPSKTAGNNEKSQKSVANGEVPVRDDPRFEEV
jgi:methyl-accepting chemotaxis protein